MYRRKFYNSFALLTLSFITIFIAGITHAQNVAINADGSKANPNAMLDIQSANKGLLIPRMSSEARQRITPTQGLLVYDINTNSFWYNTGRQWLNISSSATADAVSSTDAWLLGGNAGTVDNTHFLGTTDNVALNIRVNNQRSGRIDGVLNNTFWGFRSGFNITTGNDNTGIGASALFGITTGFNNTAVGANALQSNATGYHNAALGRFVLMSNTTGHDNVATGTGALFSNTEGSFNSVNGGLAMYNNTSGNQNVAIGYEALRSNTSADSNVAIGYQAMYSNTLGHENTAVGYRALYSIPWGTWNTAFGSECMYSLTEGHLNTAYGARAMYSTTTGWPNTALGMDAMFFNTTGTGNTAVGLSVMLNNISGRENTAVGHLALSGNMTGDRNTSLGYLANPSVRSGTDNTAVGHASMIFTQSGSRNTAIGAVAFNAFFGGEENTALGYAALNQNSGIGNTALGAFANTSGNGLQNSTALGYNAISNASNKVRIGNAAVTVIEGQVPFTFPSDGRYKFGVQEDIKGLDFILQLRPVSYQFDTKRFDKDLHQSDNNSSKELDFNGKKIHIQSPNDEMMESSYQEASGIRRSGFIAQEVEQAAKRSDYNFSGLIAPGKQQQHYSLSYDAFVVPLVKAVQEQQQIIEEQNKKIAELQEQNKKIADLQRQLDEIQKMLTRSN